MQRDYVLTILYDLVSTIGSEISLKPMLVRVMQRFMFHTGFPAAMVFLHDGGVCHLQASIGDAEAQAREGEVVALPEAFLSGKPRFEALEPIEALLPCRQGRYRRLLLLPIGTQGCLILLTPVAELGDVQPLMFSPVQGNLGRAIELCRNNDERHLELSRLVEERTRELHKSEEYIRLLLASTAEAIFGVDPKGQCTFANQSFLSMLAFEHLDEVLGQPIHPLIHHSYPDGQSYPVDACPAHRAYMEGKRIDSMSDTFWRRDGRSVPVQYSVYPIVDDERYLGAVVSFRDMTQALIMRREQEELRRNAESSQRLESLGLLAGGIAHDFNNILTAIMANAGLLRSKLGADSFAERYVESILGASRSAADLCRQMLAYSGKGRFVLRNPDLAEVVLHMSKLLEVSIGKQTQLSCDLKPGLAPVYADEAQLQQVIMNLITNASDAIGDRPGEIRLSCSELAVSDAQLADMFGENPAAGRYLLLAVSDDGRGMSETVRRKMFEPFFSTKAMGRGLGMSAIHGIVRSHGGEIAVDSQVGRGTTIRIYLPAASGQAEVRAAAIPATDEQWQPAGTVLVIDDEPDVRDAATAILEDAGFEVVTADDGQQGVERYRDMNGQVAAVLLDMNMPIMNGEETFTLLREINPDVRVLLSSGYNEQEVTEHFLGKGLAGFIQKPYLPSTLIKRFRAILAD